MNVVTRSSKKVQMGGSYPESLVDDAHEYARRHRLHLNVVLAAAIAEYLAKRADSKGDNPAPQLHYRRGHESVESIRFREELMRVDPRGRKLQPRTCRAKSESDGHPSEAHGVKTANAVDTTVAHDATDGISPRRASQDPAQVRQRRPPRGVRDANGRSGRPVLGNFEGLCRRGRAACLDDRASVGTSVGTSPS